MTKLCRSLVLAASAGLAVSGAQAQLAISTSQPGTWETGIDIAANLVAGSQGDDTNNALTVPAAYSNEVLTGGGCYVSSNGKLMASPGSNAYANVALVATGPFGYYPCWDDLHCGHQLTATPPSGIYAKDLGTKFVVQWDFDAFTPANTGTPGTAAPYAKMQVDR